MSVAGSWKDTSHARGWSAWAAAPEKSTAEAAVPAKNSALARNFLIALSSPTSRDLVAPITDDAGIGNPGLSLGGSNHTLFPSARKERRKPCGIFARNAKAVFGARHAIGATAPIRANLLWKSTQLPVSGRTGDRLVLYLARAQLKVP
jgi:hypothetical protein